MLNRTGLSTDPWGTPLLTDLQLGFARSLPCACCRSAIHLTVCSSSPYLTVCSWFYNCLFLNSRSDIQVAELFLCVSVLLSFQTLLSIVDTSSWFARYTEFLWVLCKLTVGQRRKIHLTLEKRRKIHTTSLPCLVVRESTWMICKFHILVSRKPSSWFWICPSNLNILLWKRYKK